MPYLEHDKNFQICVEFRKMFRSFLKFFAKSVQIFVPVNSVSSFVLEMTGSKFKFYL